MLSLNHLSLQLGPSWGYKCAQSQTQPPLPSFSHHPARVTAWGTLLTQPSGLTLDTVLPCLGSSEVTLDSRASHLYWKAGVQSVLAHRRGHGGVANEGFQLPTVGVA